MTDTAKRRIHLAVGAVISLLIVVTGILFCIKCHDIYKIGLHPFTYENIGRAFSEISAMVYITLVAVVAGIVTVIAFPIEGKKSKALRSKKVIYEGFAKKADISLADDETRAKINKERKQRCVLGGVNIALIALSAVLPLIYLLNPANFPAEAGQYNNEIMHGMIFYVVCLLPLVAYEFIYFALSDASYSRETELLKALIKENGVSNVEKEPSKASVFFSANKKPILLGVRVALLLCGGVFVVLGIVNGGVSDVLQKAINICAECIGLG